MADRSVPNNIYTVLTLVALLVLLAGVGYLLYRSNELFGSYNPMDAAPLGYFLPSSLTSMLG